MAKEYGYFEFDPIEEFDLNIPKKERQAALEDAATYLKEAMLEYIGEGKSPVGGGKWVKGLLEPYKSRKADSSSADFANLEETGALLDSLDVSAESTKIVVQVGEDQTGKAEGHLTGIYGDHMTHSPRPRQFMPTKGETFKKQILNNLKKILKSYEDG